MHMAAELHDIGKTGIPDAILVKAGPLDEDEWRFMRRHTLIGERIVRAAPSLAPAADLVRSSHEHLDGSGYPDGLSGDAIPLGSRIIAACDAFNAMTSDRPYRKTRAAADAVIELRRCAGTQFDPDVVEALAQLIETDGASALTSHHPDRTLNQL
jgi:HD-GYP domain-containing protein (c-di-GMP phosphodiesterase class II)